MAVAITRPTPNPDTTWGNKKRRVRDIVFSGTYTAGTSEVITAAQVGLKVIDEVSVHGGCVRATAGTGNPVAIVYPSATQVRVVAYEGAAALSPLAEKATEAWEAGTAGRFTFIGY